VVVIADAGPLPLPPPLIDALIWMCLVTTLLSGLMYVVVWGARALRKGPRRDS
jgi:cardiolipin synthase